MLRMVLSCPVWRGESKESLNDKRTNSRIACLYRITSICHLAQFHLPLKLKLAIANCRCTQMRLVIVGICTVLVVLYYFLISSPPSRRVHSYYMSDEAANDHVISRIKENAERYAEASAAESTRKDRPRQIKTLKSVFAQSDTNRDGYLELEEIINRVSLKVKEHLTLALRENFFLFTALDQDPRNGVVSWDEYYNYLLKQHGYEKQSVLDKTRFSRKLKEAIMRDKAAWSEAARSNPDHLTIDEFLAFRHPESSHASMLAVLDETLSKLDVDGDGALNEDEFSDPLTNGVSEYTLPEEYRANRIKEFRVVVDLDKDGKADRKELIHYVDPRNVHHSEKEASYLLASADEDHDGMLSLHEFLDKSDIMMYSKIVDAAKSFHDEF